MTVSKGTAPAGRSDTRANIEAAYRKARALHEAGRLREAAQGYTAVARAAPALAEPHYQLGRIALAAGDAAAAVESLEAARARKPDEPQILSARAQALAAAGQTDAALAAHDALIRKLPREVKPRADKALLLQQMGDFDAAEAELKKALKRAPHDGELFRMLVTARRMRKGEPLIAQMIDAHHDAEVTGRSRMQLQFALAKAMADTGEYDKVFRFLDPANAAMRKAFPYEIAQRRAEVDGLIEAFRGADFSPVAAGGARAAVRPIFVTGLPRSGTTLVEQILASHRDVAGAGERRFVLEEAYRVMGDPARGFTPLSQLDDAAVAGFGDSYLQLLARAVPDAPVVTDKSIQTHLVIGLVAKALPEARIVVVRRDPRDLGLSIYRNVFAPRTHLYAYDQADIAAYVATFEKMMAFWREALPDRFTEVRYEDLVADPEPQTRRLVEAAGLDWDPACLSFHETERQVATLSIQQVRQPIHAGAAGGWRRYEADLAPMIAAFEREGVELP